MPRPIVRDLRYEGTREGTFISIHNDTSTIVVDVWPYVPNTMTVKQVYTTSIRQRQSKGPILHRDRLTSIVPVGGELTVEFIEDRTVVACTVSPHQAIDIPPGIAVRYVNAGSSEINLIVLSDRSWVPGDNESQKFDGWDAYRRMLDDGTA